MPYDIQKTYPSFGQGISDDSFLGSDYSVQDMDGIDVQSEERYAQCDFAYYIEEDRSLSGMDTYGWFQNTPYGNFVSNGTSVMLNGTTLSLGGTIWDKMISYGSGTSQVNYFFERTSGVKTTAYDGTSPSSFYAGGYPAGATQITSVGWHIQNILFSQGNKIYYFNTTTLGSTLATTLQPGTEVLAINVINLDSIVIIARNGVYTQIYELEYTGGAYNVISFIEDRDFTCSSAVGSKYDTFLIGRDGVYQYQGRQIQHVKYIPLSASAKCTYDKGLIILDGTNLYKLSKKKPGRGMILTKTVVSADLVSNNYILDIVTGGFKTYTKSSGYKRTNTITLRPLDGGSYETPKHDLCYRIGYICPELNTPTPETEKCGIKIEVQTDEMEKDNSSTYATVYEEYTDFLGYRDITPQEVVNAIDALGYSSQFGYARTRVTLYAGAEIGVTDIYEKTPKLFDLTIKANYVKAQ